LGRIICLENQVHVLDKKVEVLEIAEKPHVESYGDDYRQAFIEPVFLYAVNPKPENIIREN
jgi:hypothetical protein